MTGDLRLNDLHQVRDLRHHTANGGIVRSLDYLIQTRETQSFNYQFLLYRCANRGAHPLQMVFRAPACVSFLGQFVRHDYSSSTDLPRMAATSLRFFKCFSASNVALMTLCGLVVPIDFVRTF